MEAIPGTPLMVFSIGWVTRTSTCWGESPGASVWITTCGGENSGKTLYLAWLKRIQAITQERAGQGHDDAAKTK